MILWQVSNLDFPSHLSFGGENIVGCPFPNHGARRLGFSPVLIWLASISKAFGPGPQLWEESKSC